MKIFGFGFLKWDGSGFFGVNRLDIFISGKIFVSAG